MSKQFEWFCRERVILGQRINSLSFEEGFEEINGPFEAGESTQVFVKYYVCVRLSNKLIGNNQLYNKLGLLPETDLIATRIKVEIDKFRNFKDAFHFGLFSEVQFAIIPLDPQRTVEPYGNEYSSYVAYNTSIPFDTIKRNLQDHEFKFMSGIQTVTYQVVPGSLKIKRIASNRRTL